MKPKKNLFSFLLSPMVIHPRYLPLIFFLAATSVASPSSSLTAPLSPPSLPSPPLSLSPPSPSPSPIQQRSRRSPPRRSRRPGHPSSLSPPLPLLPQPEATPEQLNNIIDALIGDGDFGDWIGMVASAVLPLSATIFVLESDGGGAANSLPSAGDPFTFSYHVIPQRLSFSELLQFKTNARLPTLLPGKSLVITNNSPLNFSIDDSPITVPDLYTTTALAVHGIARIFDNSVYGQENQPKPPADQSEVVQQPPAPADGRISGWSSDAWRSSLCIEFPVVLVVVCAALGFKIHRNSFK